MCQNERNKVNSLNFRWEQTDPEWTDLPDPGPSGMLVVGTEDCHDYHVFAQEVPQKIGQMIVHDVIAHDVLLAACRAAREALPDDHALIPQLDRAISMCPLDEKVKD